MRLGPRGFLSFYDTYICVWDTCGEYIMANKLDWGFLVIVDK